MRRGFTLMEMLVVTVIMSAALASLMMAFAGGINVRRQIEKRELAAFIAAAKMEELKSVTYTNIPLSPDVWTYQSQDVIPGLTGYTITVKSTKPQDPAVLTVKVSWPPGGSAASVVLTTLVADY